MKVALDSYRPDDDPFKEGTIVSGSNLIPDDAGYKTAPTLADAGYNALAAACKGAATVIQVDGSVRLFAGTATALYEGAGGTWTDVTRTTGAYALSTQTLWQFEQFGDITLAAAKTDTLQYIDDVMTDFANLTAPKVGLICVSGQFVMAADCDDTSAGLGTAYGDQGDRWWCSGYGDYSEWTPALSTQCTTGRLVDTPGSIKALKRIGNNVVAYKSSGIYIGSYVGPPIVWSWQLVDAFVGTDSPDSVVNIGKAHLFIGEDDIYLFDGASVTPIGDGVKKHFFASLNKTYRPSIRAVHDAENSLVWWFYPTGSDGTLNRALIYNYDLNKWGAATRTIEAAASVVVDGVTYDSLGSYYSSYDSMPSVQYDDPIFSSTSPSLAVFDNSHVLKTIDGGGDQMEIVTGWQGDDDMNMLLTRVRPRFILPPSSGTMRNDYTSTSSGAESSTPIATLNNGKFDVIKESRWHQYNFTFTSDCLISGFTVQMRDGSNE